MFQIPLNIDRNAMAEMKAAESSGAFDYDPNFDPSNMSASFAKPSPPINAHHVPTDNLIDTSSAELPSKERTPPLAKRKNSLEDFELEIEGITLDDDIDTSVCIEAMNELSWNCNEFGLFFRCRTLI